MDAKKPTTRGGIIDDYRVTLDFSERHVAGKASCNSYQGTWSAEDGMRFDDTGTLFLTSGGDDLLGARRER